MKQNNAIRRWGKKKGQHARYATCDIRKDEVILYLKKPSRKIDHPTAYTIQFDKDIHYEPLRGTYYLNHSCNPTGYIFFDDCSFRALRDVRKGEELTFHYCTTELELSAPFQCVCGSENCMGWIRGFMHMSEGERERLFPLLSPYLRNILLK